MNSRGILFTAMVFLMILSIITLNSSIMANRAQEQHFTVPSKILRVSELFENIQSSVIELKKSAEATAIEKRILPFDYNFGTNSLSMGFELPFRDSDFNTYLDTLNMSKIMLKNKDYNNIYSGLNVDVNTVDWNSSTAAFHFLIEPFCYELAFDRNSARYQNSNSGRCHGTFNFSHVKEMDLNVTISQYNEDYNLVSCSLGPCVQNPPPPYFDMNIYDSDCGNCKIPLAQKNVHLPMPLDGATQQITISCFEIVKAGCTSTPITITLSNTPSAKGISIDHNITRIGVSLKHSFDGNVSSFKLLDFNVSVSTPDGKIVKSNNPEAIR